jgi:hypothetical protein
MSSIADQSRALRRCQTLRAFVERLGPALPLVVVVFTAIFLRFAMVTATDVSWLITVSEKVLEGSRLYVDLIENNPPASVLFYLPPVALARVVGLAPEVMVDAFVFFSATASLLITSRILSRGQLLEGVDGWTFATVTAILLLILPSRTFGQREHIAVIVLLPALAAYLGRAQKVIPNGATTFAAGVGIGIALCIKPYFAFAIGLIAAAAAWHARSWRSLFAVEHWIAACIVAIYGASICLLYPEFISDIFPLVQTVYVPHRRDLWVTLTHGSMFLWLASVFLIAWRKQGALFAPRFTVLLTASFGFALAYVVQGKGWPYHTYPMLALAFLALGILLCERDGSAVEDHMSENSLGIFAAALTLFAVGFYAMGLAVDFTPLAEIIRRQGAQPKMLSMAADIGVGHPLVRQVGGKWVQRVPCLWITNSVDSLLKTETSPAATARLAVYAARDRAMLVEDIKNGKPDIILLGEEWKSRARSDAVLAALLRDYREVGGDLAVTILRRD